MSYAIPPNPNNQKLLVAAGYVVFILMVILLMLSTVHAQDTTQPPDTPSAVQAQTPVCQNGQPYQTGETAKLVGSCPFDKHYEKWNGTLDGFFHFGNANRWLHPTKTSYVIFGVAHAGLIIATVVAVHDPRSREQAHSEYPAMAAETALDFLVFRTISPSLSVAGPIYGMEHYSLAATR